MKPMSAIMRKALSMILVAGFFLACGISCKKEKEEKARPVAEPILPLNLVLKYTAGGPGGTSLLTLRFFGARMGMNSADRKPQKTGKETESAQEIQALEIPPDFWTKSVNFFVAEGEGTTEGVELEQGVTLVAAPGVQKLQLGPEAFCQALYSLSASAVPQPGKTLKATVLIGKQRYDSNAVTVPGPPVDEWERWVREAVVALQVGRFDSVLEAAEGMIALHPEAHHGYWYRGLALEAKGNFEEALAAMRTALEKYPKSTKDRYQEPPDKILQKIRQFESRRR